VNKTAKFGTGNGNGNSLLGMGGNGIEKDIPAHLYSVGEHCRKPSAVVYGV